MKNDGFKKILSEKENVTLSEDFDNEMMSALNMHIIKKATDKKYIRLMYFFFTLGLIFGFIIAFSIVDVEFSLNDKVYFINKFVLQIPLILVILLIFEKIYKATLVNKGKEKFSF